MNYVWLDGNPLSSDSINIYIPQLKARGVFVEYYNSSSLANTVVYLRVKLHTCLKCAIVSMLN